jgi:cobalt-zinc-cadmium resistance protein CzcA
MNNKIFLCFVLLNVSFSFAQKATTIDKAIKTAIENNPQIKSAKFNLEKEEAVKLKSFNIPRPELFVEYEGVKGSLNNFESRKIGILQELEFPANYFLRSDVQSSQILAAKAELNNLINELKFEVKQNYLNLLLQTNLLEIAEENLKIYNDFLLVAERKYVVGLTSNIEVLSAKVSKIKFENDVKNIQSQIRIYQAELKKLMYVDYLIIPAEELKYTEFVLSKDNMLKSALTNNPELMIAKFQKEKFSNKISLTRSELLPNLSLSYYNQKIGNESGFWGFEVGVGIPLWFWWEPLGNIKEANYEYKIASSDEIYTRRAIESEINQSFVEYENSLRQLMFFRDEALKESEEILRQARISYEEGAIDYIEYLQALNVWFDTKTQYSNSIYNYNYSIIKLEKFTAGDIK